jgi:hypothetical protein
MPASRTRGPVVSEIAELTTMSSKSTTAVKAAESSDNQQRADNASDAFMIGVDTEGREHYHSRIRDRMSVLDDGEHVRTVTLDGRPLSNWMAFIEQEHGGWRDTNVYSGSTTDHLCDQLATAVNGGGTQ